MKTKNHSMKKGRQSFTMLSWGAYTYAPGVYALAKQDFIDESRWSYAHTVDRAYQLMTWERNLFFRALSDDPRIRVSVRNDEVTISEI